MVEPYVEALRYLTPLGFDVLTFVIIDRLAGSGARWPPAAVRVAPSDRMHAHTVLGAALVAKADRCT